MDEIWMKPADGSTGFTARIRRSLRSIAPGWIRAPAESSMVSARTRLWRTAGARECLRDRRGVRAPRGAGSGIPLAGEGAGPARLHAGARRPQPELRSPEGRPALGGVPPGNGDPGGVRSGTRRDRLDESISRVFSRMKALGLMLADRAGLPVAGRRRHWRRDALGEVGQRWTPPHPAGGAHRHRLPLGHQARGSVSARSRPSSRSCWRVPNSKVGLPCQ
jgi:hypothetical protein